MHSPLIGVLYGMEEGFPASLVSRINGLQAGISAESVQISSVRQAEALPYTVLLDRISHDVPFYRSMLKNAAITGTAVLNNPFWSSSDEKFFNNALAKRIGVPVPKTVLLPSKELPEGTGERSFRNLIYPLDWNRMFEYIGFPAYLKPHNGGGWKNVYRVNSESDFYEKYANTGRLVMMLQEEIVFEHYVRCYCIDRREVLTMGYEPRNPEHLRYLERSSVSGQLATKIYSYVIALNQALGYDINTVEFAIKDGIPYAIDFCNPVPDAAPHAIGEENFEWVLQTTAQMLIQRATANKSGKNNLTWGSYVRSSVSGEGLPQIKMA